jgi:hypothetical protein
MIASSFSLIVSTVAFIVSRPQLLFSIIVSRKSVLIAVLCFYDCKLLHVPRITANAAAKNGNGNARMPTQIKEGISVPSFFFETEPEADTETANKIISVPLLYCP